MKYLTVILSVCFWGWSPRYLQAKKNKVQPRTCRDVKKKKKKSKYKGKEKRENKPIRECEIHLDHP